MRKGDALQLLLVAVFLMQSATALAGPGPKSPVAALSGNGKVLATCEMAFDGSDDTKPRKVTSSTFAVHTRPLRELNEGLRMSGPNTYWDYQPLLTTWRVQLPSTELPRVVGCPYMLVTDDGEYLLLLQSYTFKGAILLFRRHDHRSSPRIEGAYNSGVLVREIPMDEVMPPPTSSPSTVFGTMMTGHTPQWYSYGTFSFSTDSSTLLYKKNSGTVRIELATGVVTQDAVSGVKP